MLSCIRHTLCQGYSLSLQSLLKIHDVDFFTLEESTLAFNALGICSAKSFKFAEGVWRFVLEAFLKIVESTVALHLHEVSKRRLKCKYMA